MSAERHRKLADGSPEWSTPSDIGDGPRRLLVHACGSPFDGMIDIELAYMTSASERAERLADGSDGSVSVDVEEAKWLLRRLPSAIAAARHRRGADLGQPAVPPPDEAYKLGELIGTQQALVDVHGPALPLWALGQVVADHAETHGDDGLAALAEDVKRAGRRIAVAAVVLGWELRTVDRRGMAWLVADVIASIGGTEFLPLSGESATKVLRTLDIEPLAERVDALVAAWR